MVILNALFPRISEDHPNPNHKLLPTCVKLSKAHVKNCETDLGRVFS